MKRRIKRITSFIMTGVMLSTIAVTNNTPVMQRIKAAATSTPKPDSGNGKRYISDIKIAMGETEKMALGEAVYLEKEGYTFLDDGTGTGNLADLNKGAGTSDYNILKAGPKNRVVYLGYKTTDDPEDAITDLAVMNMGDPEKNDAAYSIEDYNILMEQYKEKQIIPFLDNFLSTLEEYRANYNNKDKNSLAHIRADYMRQMMNKLIDDDTGSAVGDLLLKQTKYEMGDYAYNQLSDELKKDHADILTLLTQANGKAVLTIESLLTKASDSSNIKDKKTKKIITWADRFAKTTLENLREEIERSHSEYTKKEVNDALDRKYYDSAMKILGDFDSDTGKYMNWDSFRDGVLAYEDTADELGDDIEVIDDNVEQVGNTDLSVSSDGNIEIVVHTNEEDEDDENIDIKTYMNNVNDANHDVTKKAMDLQMVSICDYLSSVKYKADENDDDESTLLDFFSQDSDEVSGKTGIRKLYPIVDALSAGQEAGLEFVSLADLFSIALATKDTYKDINKVLDKIEPASVYENVNREIYEKGAVALTSDAIRAKAKSTDIEEDGGYKMGTLPIIFWSVTAGCAVATAITVGAYAHYAKGVTENIKYLNITNGKFRKFYYTVNMKKTNLLYIKKYDAYAEDNIVTEVTKAPTTLFKVLAVGTVLLTVAMTAVSTYLTIKDVVDYYKASFVPIPRYMVDEVDITAKDYKGDTIIIPNQTAYYKAAECTRFEGFTDVEKENYEILGTKADLNGDIGKQWLALYYVKYEYGAPILADSLKYQIDGKSVPSGYKTGIHEFGGKAACNLNKKTYLYADNPPKIKVYYKNDSEVVREAGKNTAKNNNSNTGNSNNGGGITGSVFSKGSLALGGGIGVIVGFIFGMLVMRRKRKVVYAGDKQNDVRL